MLSLEGGGLENGSFTICINTARKKALMTLPISPLYSLYNTTMRI